jgi:hypothetical protein
VVIQTTSAFEACKVILKEWLENFNCCFTMHFDKFKAFLPTDALLIKT